jgi:hypothetical protein
VEQPKASERAGRHAHVPPIFCAIAYYILLLTVTVVTVSICSATTTLAHYDFSSLVTYSYCSIGTRAARLLLASVTRSTIQQILQRRASACPPPLDSPKAGRTGAYGIGRRTRWTKQYVRRTPGWLVGHVLVHQRVSARARFVSACILAFVRSFAPSRPVHYTLALERKSLSQSVPFQLIVTVISIPYC